MHQWDLGSEDALQIDVLLNLPPGGGYEQIITALDVFSRYLLAYPITEASATSTAKLLVDNIARYTYLPTTLITGKGTAFTSRLVDKIATHASLKCNLKMASGEDCRQWHKSLALATFNYITTYHSNLGYEPSRIFQGRVPCNLVDHM